MLLQTDESTCANCGTEIMQCVCDKPTISLRNSRRVAPPEITCSEWMDALRESKGRIFRARVCYYDKHAQNPPGYIEAMAALTVSIRLTESASIGALTDVGRAQ